MLGDHNEAVVCVLYDFIYFAGCEDVEKALQSVYAEHFVGHFW